jgi:HlyD family secretion protein
MKSRLINFAVKYFLPFVALLAIGYAAWRIYAGRPNDQKLPPVIAPAGIEAGAANPSPNNVAARVAGAGVVEPSSEIVNVAVNASGVVSSVNVIAGQVVKKGQILFTLDGRELAALLNSRQAEVEAARRTALVAEAELADKQALLMLYQSISDKRAVAGEELLRRQGAVEVARTRMEASRAQTQSARAVLAQSRTQIELLNVRAPLAGAVLQLRLKPGEFVQAATSNNTALIALGNITPLHVRVDFDEADVSRLAIGSQASVSARGASGAPVMASFVRAEPVISPKRSLTNAADERVDTRVLQVIYALPVNTPGFYVGQQVDAFVSTTPSLGAALVLAK